MEESSRTGTDSSFYESHYNFLFLFFDDGLIFLSYLQYKNAIVDFVCSLSVEYAINTELQNAEWPWLLQQTEAIWAL